MKTPFFYEVFPSLRHLAIAPCLPMLALYLLKLLTIWQKPFAKYPE